MTLLTFAEAAELAGVHERTIRRRVDSGDLPAVREGARVKVRATDIERLYSRQPARVPLDRCRVIAFANQKGGVGKTSTCANLAAALSVHYRVLAIDCDPQGNLTQALGPDPDSLILSLYNVLIERLPLTRAMLNPVLGHPTLSLVGANLELAAADHQLAGVVAREMRLKQTLDAHLSSYDFIFIDCPPALGLLTLNALTAATEVIVPVEMGVFSLRGVAKLLDTIAEVRAVNPDLSRVRALANRTDNTNLTSDVHAELKRSFGDELFKTTIRRSVRVGEAQTARSPITVYRPSDKAAQDYLALAEEVKNG